MLGVMGVCGCDSECEGKLGSRVNHRMDFVSVDVLLFDVVPAPCCLRVIRVGWDDAAIFNNGGDAEEFRGDELLNDLFEEVVEGAQSDAFDEVAVITDVGVVFEAEMSSPELVFFKEIMVVTVGFHAEEHKEKREEHPGW